MWLKPCWVDDAFKFVAIVPWHLSVHWRNWLLLTHDMQFVVSHVYQEDNGCVDKLADHGLQIPGFICWDLIPNFLRYVFFQDRSSLPSYMFLWLYSWDFFFPFVNYLYLVIGFFNNIWACSMWLIVTLVPI